ncbi:PucR family transcriptional regulator [Pimelobacter simplex]|uniref:PucR family transcriptional regulator n=1 Tax=Nocardioides simplex TaxID=2045 RepID=A0A7J5E0A9_NOCSI|nr:helix-turn-helix domain-containing protein [Pimelobacter simplex]KAB2811334.1 PucR family transcriptional regulator [Pimelobacter simplex]
MPVSTLPVSFLSIEASGSTSTVRLRPDRLALLCQRMVRAVSTSLGTPPDDPHVRSAIADVVQCFIAAGGRAEDAAHDAERVVRALAVELSHAGLLTVDVHRLFRAVHPVVVSALGQVVDDTLRGDAMLALRRAAQRYLHLVCTTMTVELRRESARRAHRHAHWRAEVGGTDEPLPHVAHLDHSGRVGRIRVLVAVRDELPVQLRADPRFVARSSAYELLVPEDVAPETLEPALTGQVVVGPLTPWADLGDSLQLVWRATRLLSDGLAADDRLLVPCTEMLGHLLVAGNPLLTGLLVSKHLAVFDGVRALRRNDLALTLLRWLETAVPTNQLARDMGLPPQTLHSRLAKLREMFGAKLEDPPTRLELIVALRSVLPTWDVAV